MPAIMDDIKFEVALLSDQNKPKESRPVFVFKPMTISEWKQTIKMEAKIENCKNGLEVLNQICDVICRSLVGWRCMKDRSGKTVRFNKNRLADIINMQEAAELIEGIKNQGQSQDQGNSEVKK